MDRRIIGWRLFSQNFIDLAIVYSFAVSRSTAARRAIVRSLVNRGIREDGVRACVCMLPRIVRWRRQFYLGAFLVQADECQNRPRHIYVVPHIEVGQTYSYHHQQRQRQVRNRKPAPLLKLATFHFYQ